MRFVLGVTLTALASCTTSPAVESRPDAAPRLQFVESEVNSWGATLHRWTMDAEGKVEYTSGEQVGGSREDTVIEVRRFHLPEEQRLALAKAVQRAATILPRPEQCDEQVTDMPYGTFRWGDGTKDFVVRYTTNCLRGRDYELASTIFAADAIVDNVAKTQPVVDRHPLVHH